MSASIISLDDFNASKAQATRKPLTVLVHWSESNEFTDETEYTFDEFERKALKQALLNVNVGYDKTKITVNFSDREQYTCRVDLAVGDTLGYQDYVMQMIRYSKTQEGADYYKKFVFDDCLEFINKIDFSDRQDLSDVYAQAQAIIDADKAEKERIAQEEREAQEAAKIATKKAYDAFKDDLVIPSDAKAVIVARLTSRDDDRSDPYSDYYASKTDRTILLSWSKHRRDLFSEMRKAALNHEDTAFLSADGVEHREKYSMGHGYYLTNDGYNWHGWEVFKVGIDPVSGNGVPFGEIAIPGYKGKKAQAPTVKPKFKAVKNGDSWRVLVEYIGLTGTYSATASAMSEAIKQAWELFKADYPQALTA